MKVIITADHELLNSKISERFDRTRYLVLFNTDNGESQVWDNITNIGAGYYRTGVQCAELVSKLGADYVITGQ